MALPKLYILPNNKEHDRLQALLAVNPTRPTKAKPNTQQAIWWTIYGLNRAIRAYEGTVYDHIADLSYDTWITPIARWTQANQDWADENNLSAEDLLDRMDGNWAESVGGHRDPFQAAIEAYQADPEAYAPDMLRSTNQRRVATFCVCLANARQDAGAFFFPSTILEGLWV